jgi:hypothetical protein
MADCCDDADAHIEVVLKHQIDAARNALQEGVLTAVGVCHNCNDGVPPGVRFCDKTCSDDWQYRKNLEVKRRM